MRDPDLVQRAERAAGALERAWDRWRTMHGFGSEPLAPVSSYVGYSMEEPWGQPRVVFGVAANEAEQLAALLDGHDCYGPVHAEVAGRPDWRRMPSGDAGSPAWAIEDLSIPQQARPPAADMLPPVMPDEGAPKPTGEVPEPGGSDGTPVSGSHAEFADEDPLGTAPEFTSQELAPLPPLPDTSPTGPVGSASLGRARTRKNAKAGGGPTYRGPRYQGSSPRYKAVPDVATPVHADAADTPAASAAATARAAEAGPAAPDAVDSSVAADAAIAPDAEAGLEPTAVEPAVGEPAVGEPAAVEPEAVEPKAVEPKAVEPKAGAEPEAAVTPATDVAANTAGGPDTAKATATTAGKPVAGAAGKPARPRPRPAPKVNRTRRQGPGAHDGWDAADEESAAENLR